MANPDDDLLPGVTLERNSPLPLYFQLAEVLEAEIQNGRWGPGVLLPSEPILCDRFGLSRPTVRQALERLEQAGLLERHQGKGTFVANERARTWLLQSSIGFFGNEMVRRGREVRSVVISAERAPLPQWASGILGLAPGSEGAVLERLRFVDGLAALYVINYLPAALAEIALRSDGSEESLYERLRAHAGVTVTTGERVLEAVVAEGRPAELLEVAPGTPLMFIESRSSDQRGAAFDCFHAWLRTDRMKVDVHVSTSS